MGDKLDEIEKIEDSLALQSEMISQTESWWAIVIAKKVARYQVLTNKLQQTFDQNLIPEIELLEKQIKHLKDKSLWEQNEIRLFEDRQDKFEKLKERVLMAEFSSKLAQKLAKSKNKRAK